jgi:hypothetical protein
MWPSGRPAGAGCAIPARPARFRAGEGAEEGPSGSRAWFGCLDGVEVAGGGVLGGARHWPPRRRWIAGEVGPGLGNARQGKLPRVPREV